MTGVNREGWSWAVGLDECDLLDCTRSEDGQRKVLVWETGLLDRLDFGGVT